MNWVERLYSQEENLKDFARLWSDVYTAISSAVASWNKHYLRDKPQIEMVETDQNSHIQIAVPSAGGSVQIDVNLNGDKFIARYSSGLNNRTFHVDADYESAYIKCGSDRCSVDEVSRRILEPVLRPETLSGPRIRQLL